jgi:uncharacterized membrane protein YeiH
MSNENEDFDFGAIFGESKAEEIEIAEMETVIRDSWSAITHVAGGVYRDALANGLPPAVSEYVTKEFLYSSLTALRKEGI